MKKEQLQELLTSVKITEVKVNSTAGEDNNCSIFAFLMATFPLFTGYSYLNQICILATYKIIIMKYLLILSFSVATFLGFSQKIKFKIQDQKDNLHQFVHSVLQRCS